jgi:hypothetical protein
MRHVCKRLRDKFAQIKKRKVALSTEATEEKMDDEPLEEEKAFNDQVNRDDDTDMTEKTPEN